MKLLDFLNENHNFRQLILPFENVITAGILGGMENQTELLFMAAGRQKKLICGMEEKNVVAYALPAFHRSSRGIIFVTY